MPKIDWEFAGMDMSRHPESAVEATKDLVEGMINEVELPMDGRWVKLTPEMLVYLILETASSAFKISKGGK